MPTVLHYTGYRSGAGGVVAVIRALHGTGRFQVVHGVTADFVGDDSGVPLWRGPAIAGETINLSNLWRARTVARAVQRWLAEEPDRIFHGHSRAGLLVALWLHRWGERRVVASVHCYGRQRWFYRHAARQLGSRLTWLTPAMRRYYGVVGEGWAGCVPGGVGAAAVAVTAPVPVTGRLRLGGAGALVRWKRWDLILRAIAALPAEVRAQVTFEHIGAVDDTADSRAYAAELVGLTESLGLADRVQWRGAEANSGRLLGAVDLVVVASDQEPYSLVIQEAWAAGMPVVAADSGGPHDVVQVGRNGWLFRDGDASALAEVLAERWRRGDWAALDRTAIRQSARRAETAAAEWAALYARL